MAEPEIRKDFQDLETDQEAPKAAAPTKRERFAGIYPEEDPRKFNTYATEQEVADYIAKDHTQPIDSLHAVSQAKASSPDQTQNLNPDQSQNLQSAPKQTTDQALIHAARLEEEPPKKVYPKINWKHFGVATAVTLLGIILPFMLTKLPGLATPLIHMVAAFISSVIAIKDYRAFKKNFPTLGFNPLNALFWFDILIIMIGIIEIFIEFFQIILFGVH